MLQHIRTLFLLVSIFAVTPLTLSAQEVTDATTDAAQQVQQKGEHAVSTIKSAFRGNKEAQSELINSYLFPAVVTLGILILAYFVASFISRIVSNMFSSRVDKTLGRFFGKITKTAIMVFVLFAVMNHFGIDVTSFAAILAAVGFAVGMALQGTLSNFAAGIMLLVFRPFKIDQYIQVADVEGTVEGIDLFTTQLNTPDNRHLIVPNGQIFGATITNYARNDLRRVAVSVGVDYDADVDRTRAVLNAIMAQCPNIVEEPAPQAVLTELADSSVNWQARVWCKPEDFWSVKEQLTVLVKKGLDLNGIGIPYPQLVLHKNADSESSKKAA